MLSPALGSIGATRACRPERCGVINEARAGPSRSSPIGTASAMVCVGKSCSAMATSPNARSRSTRATVPLPESAMAEARLVERVVLPQPPLAEKTVTTRPCRCPLCGPSPVSTDSRRRTAISRWRRTAVARPDRSRSWMTSRTPARRASDRTAVSMRRRIITTPRLGRVTRMSSARRKTSCWSTLGPSTTQSSNTLTSRWALSASRPGSTDESGPRAPLIDSAASGSNSTIAVMRSCPRSRRRRWPRERPELSCRTSCCCWCPGRPPAAWSHRSAAPGRARCTANPTRCRQQE